MSIGDFAKKDVCKGMVWLQNCVRMFVIVVMDLYYGTNV